MKKHFLYRCALITCLCGLQVSDSFAVASVAIPSTAQQQVRTITGRVLDKAGDPIIGVTIVDKHNTGNGSITDLDGNFTIKVGENSILLFSYIGYKNVELTPDQADGKIIRMEEDALSLDEVIVTGYTTQKKADLTGSVSVVKVDQLKSGSYGSAMKAAQGKVAGMSVSANGSPTPNATIRIRGEGTLNNNDPLYIIDGTPTTRSMAELASMDIESMQVLKDASSASIYGSRAANGVIIITTRKGKRVLP